MKERERKGGIVIVIFEIRMNGQICIDLQRFCIRIFHKCFRLVDFARDEIINMWRIINFKNFRVFSNFKKEIAFDVCIKVIL